MINLTKEKLWKLYQTFMLVSQIARDTGKTKEIADCWS
jgi:hypothetical protein